MTNMELDMKMQAILHEHIEKEMKPLVEKATKDILGSIQEAYVNGFVAGYTIGRNLK